MYKFCSCIILRTIVSTTNNGVKDVEKSNTVFIYTDSCILMIHPSISSLCK